ncbi:MAG TPA: penicillin-binding transpeptidase domain-containing protein [Terriglobia bacterium]|nr:penicillin-binding transpeptidase domain-containing protein [Terriglobia bacterium]
MKNTVLALAVAASLMLACVTSLPAAGPSAGTTTTKPSTGSAATSHKRIVHLHHHAVSSHQRVVAHRRQVARSMHYYGGPGWTGDPGAGDDIAGEDPAIRQAAISALGSLNGSVVVLDPNTGRILSIVNQKLALTGAFTPCSTFKTVVATAGLEEGIITPETRLRAEPRFLSYFGTNRINVAQALAESSNEFFAKVGEMLGFSRVTEWAKRFGLGERAGLDIPGESPGVFPDAPPRQGGVGLLTSFGQDIEMTPLQLAAIVSAIGNGGTLYYLQYPRTPAEIADFQPRVRRELTQAAPYLPDVKQGMAASVLYGTSKLAFNSEEQIFGKTGTCSENGTHLRWFASFSSEQKPDRAIVVLLRGEGSMFGLHAPEVAGKIYRDMIASAKTGTQASSLVPATATPGAVAW